jgi:hypothetical protein
MNDDINDIAPAANAEPVVTEAVVVAEPVAALDVLAGDVLAGEAVAGPELGVAASKPKGKVGRPRKVATPDAAPLKAEKVKAPKAKAVNKAVTTADQAIVGTPAVSAPNPVKTIPAPKARKIPAKAPAAKATVSKKADVVIKTRKTAAASPRIAAPTQKDIFIMTATTTEMTETIQTAMKDAAEKAKAALEKSQAAFGDMGAFTKGNMEAVVESTKILATGLQEMSKSYVAETKTVVETMSAEIKDLASVKSPAEFFEKQNAMLRKQFDAAMAVSSKNSEAMLKLASEAFQPISNRVSLAVEKIKQAA